MRFRHAVATLLILLAGALGGRTWAGCLPLASPELRSLDADTEGLPDLAVRVARALLDTATARADPFRAAQLYAVLADAQAELSRPDAAQAAAERGLALLDGPRRSPDVDRLRLRLQLSKIQMSIANGVSEQAIPRIDALLLGEPPTSMEYACGLSVRAMAYDYLNQSDRAVADALGAYSLADRNDWTSVRLEAGYTLARNFRRAGLYDQAQAMLDTVISIATARHWPAMLGSAEYEEGQLMNSRGSFEQARSALQKAATFAAAAHDPVAAAIVEVPLCWALINLQAFDQAQRICREGSTSLDAGRPDLAALMLGYRARLDLDRGRNAAALHKLNRLIGPTIHALIPAQESFLLRARARALHGLRRDAAGYADLAAANALDAAGDIDRRNRQVAVMSALLASDALAAANRRLEDRVAYQEELIARQRQSHRLWIALAGGAAASTGLFAYLLLAGRKLSKSLRAHELILRSAGSRSPDAFLLLDENRHVQLGNRNICNTGAALVIGRPLNESLPAGLVSLFDTAIDEAFHTREQVHLSVAVENLEGKLHQHEISVLPALDGHHVLGVTLHSIDVTEVRALEREVIDGISGERQRLSSELHEGLGQQLAGVMLLLGNVSTVIKRGQPGVEHLIHEISEYVAQSIETARELARGLAPVKIGSGSLSLALLGLAEDARKRLRIELVSDCRVDGAALSDLAADHLYRVCREAVTNAALHGRCDRVAIDLRVEREALLLTIADNGIGIASLETAQKGFGIKMMAYRARLLGGDMRLTSAAQGGARVELTIPLSAANLAPA